MPVSRAAPLISGHLTFNIEVSLLVSWMSSLIYLLSYSLYCIFMSCLWYDQYKWWSALSVFIVLLLVFRCITCISLVGRECMSCTRSRRRNTTAVSPSARSQSTSRQHRRPFSSQLRSAAYWAPHKRNTITEYHTHSLTTAATRWEPNTTNNRNI